MLHERITVWLQAPNDYNTGLALLRETGYTQFTLKVLEMGSDTYNRTVLEKELSAWLQKNVLRSEPRSASTPKENSEPIQVSMDLGVSPGVVVVSKIPSSMSEIPSPAEPLGVLALKARWGPLLDERTHLKAKIYAHLGLLDQLPESAQEDRRDWAFRIKAITRELDEISSQLSFFNEYGYLPPSANDPALVIDDQARLTNVRTYVSLYRKKVKKAKTDRGKESARALLKQYEDEVARLTQKLSGHAV